jgi:hypothetical protein
MTNDNNVRDVSFGKSPKASEDVDMMKKVMSARERDTDPSLKDLELAGVTTYMTIDASGYNSESDSDESEEIIDYERPSPSVLEASRVPSRKSTEASAVGKSMSIIERIRNDMSSRLAVMSRNNSKNAPVADIETGNVESNNVDTECEHVAIQIVKTPSRAQAIAKDKSVGRRWTWGFNFKSSKVADTTYPQDQMRQRQGQHRTRVSCMTKANRPSISSICIKRQTSSASIKRNRTFDESENALDRDSADVELGLEDMNMLSMGMKRAKSSHKPMMELEVIPTSVVSSGLYSA